MSNLEVSIPHTLSQDEALARIKKLIANLQEDQKDTIKDVSEEWNGYSGKFGFRAKGFELSGEIEVKPSEVTIDGKLPFALSFFKGKISDAIKEKGTELLSSQ